jgi:DNA primase
LLGDELEMRDLQKEGKIGRIEVDLQMVDGKSVGTLHVPSALDKSETTIIAAALETIDRIGPTEAEIVVTKIEDVRGSKRDFIIARAKKLLEGLDGEGSEIGEMSKTLKEENRIAKIQEYGEERLPAGDISGNEIIVCEGRADVVNLLKNRINNVIGMNGTKLPAEIAKLGATKEITLFVDGDRGGRLIAQNVITNAKITYVAIAPDGTEVEELTGKEILLALRRRMSVKEYLSLEQRYGRFGGSPDSAPSSPSVAPTQGTVDGKQAVRDAFEKIRDTKSAVLLDGEGSVIKQVSVREVGKSVAYSKKPVFAVVIDGQATSVTIRALDECGVQYCGATTFGNVENARVTLVSL